ncbi:MAG: DNA mismatch repair protein MutS [Eubacteriales bacterium]
MAAFTPMMQQYLDLKEQYKDCILFYRLGDFYEMFFEDALVTSKELEITLTGKNCGQEERAPMCGVPHHAAEVYLNKLVEKGYKVALCEQVEDSSQTKGLVKREVVRIVTPGTNFNVQAIDKEKNNYLMCVFSGIEKNGLGECGISICDITTGEFYMTQVVGEKQLIDEIYKYHPAEIICNEEFRESLIDFSDLEDRMEITIFTLEKVYFDKERVRESICKQFQVQSYVSLGIDGFEMGSMATGALLLYLQHTQKTTLAHIARLKPYVSSTFMLLDHGTRRNLELTQTFRDKTKKGSLLGVLDRTKTAMGARMLRQYLEQPLVVKEEIKQRLDAMEELVEDTLQREEMREYLQPIYDLERLLGKISYQSATPRDLIAFHNSIAMIPPVRTILKEFSSPLLQELLHKMDDLEDLQELIKASIEEEAPLSVKDGGVIKIGYSKEIDELRAAKKEGKNWIAQLEAEDRERTGIRNMKIKYNRVFGYYYEVSHANASLVPEDYIRKQTLANAERYTNERLKELEDVILNAEEKLYELEQRLFQEVRDTIGREITRIQGSAHAIATIDVFTSLAYVAQKNQYVKPNLNEEGVLAIEEGRHPVVEQMLQANLFIANDTYLDEAKQSISIITGPNMAGKSTYMRQVALIVLMAQVGCYVPAKKANISVTDRIFTRVGASDDLASGQSTFMVEMNEVANILLNATKKSLLILDEIGRGTSTFDGLSIAWAVIEHISDKTLLGAKTLFATHYHELTHLEGKIHNVVNYCIAVQENGDDIVFLRKIIKGGADKSYGIQVAKLAGVPSCVIERAKEIVLELEEHNLAEQAQRNSSNSSEGIQSTKEKKEVKKNEKVHQDLEHKQLSLFDFMQEDSIREEIQQLTVENISPIEAWNILSSLQKKVNGIELDGKNRNIKRINN